MTYDALVTGAGGFIGGHLVNALLGEGRTVHAVDVKPVHEWHQRPAGATTSVLDLASLDNCRLALSGGATEVFHLAADMGGMGFITTNKTACMLSVLPSTHMLMAAREAAVERYFYSSSACVYAEDRQNRPDPAPLREQDAYPATPEDGYGWEKLFSERMARHFREDFGLATHIGRYHNVYGPHGTWTGGREKAPAALSRKVAVAALTGRHEIEIWGDGEQGRTFLYASDCVEGTLRLTRSDWFEPVNIGSAELVTINQLVGLLEEIAGIRVQRRYLVDAPQGVRGRTSDNTLVRRVLNWEPATALAEGMQETYRWVHDQVAGQLHRRPSPAVPGARVAAAEPAAAS